MDKLKILEEQLNQTCKLTGARWAAWLKFTEGGWDLGLQINLSKKRHSALIEFIQQPQTAAWLAGALSSGRIRYRKTGRFSEALGCMRTYLFTNSQAQSAIIVGADQLSKQAQGFFRVVASSDSFEQVSPEIPLFEQSFARLQEKGVEVSYNPQAVFVWALDVLRSAVSCKAAYIALRVGEIFRVEAAWNYADSANGFEILINHDEALTEMISNRQGFILSNIHQPPEFVVNSALPKQVRSCMVLPIAIGRRIIGLFVCVAYKSKGFLPSDLIHIQWYLERIPQSIENAIIFTDLARYLQQFALLTEMAVTASRSIDLDDVARRFVRRLRRTLRTDLVAVLLLSDDGKTLHELGGNPYVTPINFPVATSLTGYVAESGYPLRVGDVKQAPRFLDELVGVRSAMAVPLKLRGKVTGVLAAESTDRNAFTLQDEQLLIVIASHLAVLLDNVQLLQESRERANKLSLIHKVVQQIVGLTNEDKIAQVTAELIAEYFNYEFAIVLTVDEATQHLVNLGVGGTLAEMVPRGYRFPKTMGITGQVVKTGVSFFTNDTTQVENYISIHGWQGGSELCVPLREAERILGVINLESAQKNAFSEDDLVMFESLAGVVASVMLSARRYRELRVKIGHLQAARATALDISEDLEQEALFKRVVNRAKELAQAKGAALGLIDMSNQQMRVIISANPWYEEASHIIPLGSGLITHAVAIGKTFRVENYDTWEGRPELDFPVLFKAAVGVPLKLKNEIIGTLVVMDDHPGRTFQDDEVQLLELLAPQVAVAIHNARLYQELQERMQAQRQAEIRLMRSARMAAIGEMAAGVAHELNNPLTTVIGFVNLALDELPEKLPQKSDLRLVLREANRARTVVRRLLDFSRKTENVRVPTDLNALCNDVIALIQHPAMTGGVSIVLDLEQGLPKVLVDPNQIKQVLLNLLQNAIQAMPDGGFLTLVSARKARQDHDGVLLAVQDTGEGIAPEVRERIFDPFFTTRPAGEGTGLGLFVSYGIITDHGGYLDVDSQVDKGSCFTVWLPLEFGDGNG